MPIHRAEERILLRAPEHRNSLSSIYAEFRVLDPREKHLGLKKKDCRLQSKELENLLTIEWILPPGLELEGLQDPLLSAGKSFNCRNNPSQGSKTQKMPLLHIGRLPGNEAKRESPWAPMCWRILSAVVWILPRDTTKEDCLYSIWTSFRVSAPKIGTI